MKKSTNGGYDHSSAPVKPYSAETTTGKPKASDEFDTVRDRRQSLVDRKGFTGTAKPFADAKELRQSRAARMEKQGEKKLKVRESH
jgi:hypothetical protein